MRKITIDGKEYTFKFSVAASLYNECTESILDTFVSGGKVQAYAEAKDAEAALKSIIDTVTNIPHKALTLFYAGLLEFHGTGRHGDKTVKSIEDAKELLAIYIDENIGEDGIPTVTMSGVFRDMMEIIADDNFFEIAGLNDMVKNMIEDSPKEEVEKPEKTEEKPKKAPAKRRTRSGEKS